MLAENTELLERRTGHGTAWWLTGNGVTGYAQNPVMWELFGYPDYFLKDAAELLDGQYADRRQLRITYVSLHTPRRKFAQLTPTSKSAVDIFLRLDEPAAGLLETVRARPEDPFVRKIRLRAAADVNEEVAGVLLRSYEQNLAATQQPPSQTPETT